MLLFILYIESAVLSIDAGIRCCWRLLLLASAIVSARCFCRLLLLPSTVDTVHCFRYLYYRRPPAFQYFVPAPFALLKDQSFSHAALALLHRDLI